MLLNDVGIILIAIFYTVVL